MATALNSVNERRLRPIYEQLDNGNNKKAFHEAEKVLRKQKDLLAAKVLKTIALHRMGKQQEAFALSNVIVAQEPTDENSLQGLSLYYKEIQKTELISKIYEAAVKRFPTNEDYLTHLFMSYVRHEKFQEMQRVAMTLYKHHPKNPYLFWAIMAIVLQAKSTSNQKLSETMYLPLAEKMIEKHIEKGKLEAEAEVRLYLLILNLLEKHEKVLAVLKGDLGKKLTSELKGLAFAVLAAEEKANRWDRVNAEYKRLLNERPDVWNYALGYLNSFFKLYGNPPAQEENSILNKLIPQPDYTLDQVFTFINELVERENQYEWNRSRGPYLLKLEMLLRLKMNLQNQDETEQLGTPRKILLQYAQDFSSKPCCFHDVKVYLSLLSQEDVDEFIKELSDQLDELTESDVQSDLSELTTPEINRGKEKEIQRHIFIVQVARYLGKHELLSLEEKIKLAEGYMERYEKGLCYSADRPLTDGIVVDAYCVSVVWLLIDIFTDTDDAMWLWRCVGLLEYGLTNSPHNYEMKLLLIRTYCRLGLFTPCASIYDSLELKHIQHDTLGYLICEQVGNLGHFHLASQVLQVARSFYVTNNKDSVECLITCFRNGTFHKISELVSYRRRVGNSLHAAYIRTEHVLMDLYTECDIDQALDSLHENVDPERIEFEFLTDNRDFSVISDINPVKKRLCDELIDKSFIEDKRWLCFRELLLRSFQSILYGARSKNSQQNGHSRDVDSNGHVDDDYVQELEKFCSEELPPPPQYPYHGPHPTKLRLCFEAKYPQTMVSLFRYCQGLSSASEDNMQQLDELSDKIKTVYDNIKEFLETCCHGILAECKQDFKATINDGSMLTEPIPENLLRVKTGVIERLVLCMEMFSLSALSLVCMQPYVLAVKSDLQRKKRKKKGKQTPVQLPSFINDYQASVEGMKEIGAQFTFAMKRLQNDVKIIRDSCKLSEEDDEDSAAELDETLENKLNITDSANQSNQQNNEICCDVKDENSSTSNEHSSNPVSTNNENIEVFKSDEEICGKDLSEIGKIFDRSLRIAAGSILTSSKQMQTIIDARLKSLKDLKV
ncbi:unnamed protein product [Clavelina lepadiformis]|uniref:N-terminal acetyltransferase B complex subunit NAA25 homolog n=1 Tax=Clavelina lepadiformis TaxID=159417 RepID=A0ABP0GRI2_CLALP